MNSISAKALKQRLDDGGKLALIDVREPSEWQICRLDGAKLVPMGELHHRLQEIDPDAETVIYCHHGIRSAHVIAHLAQQGFDHLLNLQGGIDAWAREVDPAMRRY